MACPTALLATLSLFVLADTSFVPFAGVEELKPHRIHEHCDESTIGEDGYRWCSRSFRKRLEDGADVELSWSMHVNPDSILSLDTEAEHGVRMVRCSPGQLEMDVPQTHLQHLEVGKFIVGSRYVHGCDHMNGQSLFHKIAKVHSKRLSDGAGRMYRFQLAAQNLPHMGHVARHVSFNFSYMPIEARETHKKYPERRTFSDLPPHDRRLFEFPKIPGFTPPTSGNFAGQGQTSGSVKTQNGIVNFSPQQVSNFGWNWDFNLNNSQEPSFTIDQPDTKGQFVLKNPYIQAHAGCFLNFTSQYVGFMKPPHVKWQAGLRGHGIVQGRLEAAMNSTRSADLEASSYKLPAEVLENFPFLRLLAKFDKVKWFAPMEHGVGNLPAKITPGFQFQVEFYHKGPFSGFLSFGGSTHGIMEPVLHYDSEKGFDQTLKGLLRDTDVWPPMYKVFTEAFEMGVKCQPRLWIRGDFAGFENAEACFHINVFQNVTVYHDGAAHFDVDANKALVIYPFRVVGPATVDFDTRYKVQISCLGKEVVSDAAISWGEVEFHDPVSKFIFGNATDAEVMNAVVKVTLIQVHGSEPTSPVTTMGSCTFSITSWTKQGLTDPDPRWCNIQNDAGTSVGNVQVYVVHKAKPEVYLASRIKGIGMSFPRITLQPAAICSTFPQLPANCPLALHLTMGNRRYSAGIQKTFSCSETTLPLDVEGKNAIDFYPSFVDAWTQCAPTMEFCISPALELVCGGVSLGKASLPSFGVPQTPQPNFLGALIGAQTTTPAPTAEQTLQPPQVTLTPPTATIQFKVAETPPTSSNMFLQPAMGSEVGMMSQTTFIWTLADTPPNEVKSFDLVPLLMVEESSQLLQGQELHNLRKVADKYLLPVASAKETITVKCEQRSVGSIAAETLPCTFAAALGFNTPTFSTGEMVVLLVQWSDGGLTHKIFSPAVQIGTARRRLQAGSGPPAALPQKAAAAVANTDNVNGTHPAPDCSHEDLKFNFGQGMEFRVEVMSMGVPKDFPEMYTNPNAGPLYASPWAAMEGTAPAMAAEDFLPDGACDMGFCDTQLPGCGQNGFKKLHFPKLVFNFSRAFHFSANETTQQQHNMMKEAMAWAFSAMPEAVTVMLQELEAQEKEKKKQTAVPNYGFGNYGNAGPVNQGAGQPGQPNWFGAPSQTSAIANTQQMPSAFGKWWNTQRRLRERPQRGIDQDGNIVDMPTKLLSHQVQVEFSEGLPYAVSHELLSRMVRGRMFQVDDGSSNKLGKLQITGFYLQDMGTVSIPQRDGATPRFDGGGSPAMYGLIASVMVALGTAMAVLLALRGKSSSGYLLQTADGEGLE